MENEIQEQTPSEQTEAQEKPVKSTWQLEKESWYDHVHLTVKQLDIIIWTASALLVLVFLRIFLQSMHII